MGASLESLTDRLASESDDSIRRALILSLGEYDISPADRVAMTTKLLAVFENDPDPGIHAAAEWVLRRWGEEDELEQIRLALATGKVEGTRSWYISCQGPTMVVLSGPVEFLMGSPVLPKDRGHGVPLHRRRIGRTFTISSHEITHEQFQTFARADERIELNGPTLYAPESSCPQLGMGWFLAAAYCRWLSEQEHIEPDQMCYPPISEIKDGMRLPPDYLSRTGYRLPTMAEWEYACRAGTATSRYYGESLELLGEYAWYWENAQHTILGVRRSWPVGRLKPNDFGLFDTYGNAREFCDSKFFGLKPVVRSKGRPQEDRESDRLAVISGVTIVGLRGGHFGDIPEGFLRSGTLDGISTSPTQRSVPRGFRVARTLR